MTADDLFGRLDDDDYPAFTMGRAAEMLGTTQGFLRAIGEARLITPLRSAGGHRRYSRYQLRVAARARELVDQGTPIEAACRIVILEDQLEEAQRLNAQYREAAENEPSRRGRDGVRDKGDEARHRCPDGVREHTDAPLAVLAHRSRVTHGAARHAFEERGE